MSYHLILLSDPFFASASEPLTVEAAAVLLSAAGLLECSWGFIGCCCCWASSTVSVATGAVSSVVAAGATVENVPSITKGNLVQL